MHASITKLSPLRAGMPVMCAMLGLTASPARAQQPAPFHLQEATIASIHSAFAAGRLTCAQLTRLYLDRIEAYNLRGPALRAIITVNPRALETAAEMDRHMQANPSRRRPAALRPDRAQGQFQHRRHADDGRQCRHEGFAARPPMPSPWRRCARPAR